MSDPINHPPHYSRLSPEPIDVIESWELGYCLGCAVKYIARAGFKEGAPPVQDLEKARWYLSREIDRLKNAQAPQGTSVTSLSGEHVPEKVPVAQGSGRIVCSCGWKSAVVDEELESIHAIEAAFALHVKRDAR